jgi:YidC/Oxa1 family membrane protein insertase
MFAAISSFFYHVLTQPLTNILVLFYNTIAVRDLGVAIILLTLFIRLLLFPLFHKSTRQQLIMQHLQPKIRVIQKDLKDDKVKQTEALMALYAEHGVNPFSGFLFLLVQIPILISLYRIFLGGLAPGHMARLYSFIANPGTFHATFLGLINLNERSIVLVVLAAALQFIQGKLALPKYGPDHKPAPAEAAARNMVFVGPVITLLIFFRLPAAVALYWVTTSIVSIVQQVIVNRDLAHLRNKD